MKKSIIILIIMILTKFLYGQNIISGEYSVGLKLTYDSATKKLTGYFENYSGWDEETESPKFSCIFYIEGDVNGNVFNIQTYFPKHKSADLIEGAFEIVNNKSIKIKLNDDHGGCWNVLQFQDEPIEFTLEYEKNWIQIRYVDVDKTFFHQDKSPDKKLKAYLIKGDVVYIEKIENEWALCTYFGQKTTKGWLKLKDLNKL